MLRIHCHSAAFLAPVIGSVLLVACSSDTATVLDPACPTVALVADAAHLTRFGPETLSTPANVMAIAELRMVDGTCAYRDDGVDIQFDLAVLAERGPALTVDRLPLSYFVSVTSPDRMVLEWQSFETEVRFENGVRTAGSQEALEQWIPLTDVQAGPNHAVLVGFRLSRAELAFNREGRSR